MATIAQIKALFESYISKDDERFITYGLQIAAHEAKLGHGKIAEELRRLIDIARKKRDSAESGNTVPLVQPQGELARLLSASYPNTRLSEMILSKEIASRLDRIIQEQRHIEEITAYGLQPRRKFLLIGPPGTGKTMTAFALAGELHLPLFIIRLESIITKYMGETSAKLRMVFDSLQKHRGVYLFDEFDSIGAMRALNNDVGEIRRVLNSFLQFIDHDCSNSMILAATNHPKMLDYALFRRFDDVIEYSLPDNLQISELLKNKLAGFVAENIDYSALAKNAKDLSFAEITRACEDSIKEMIIARKKCVTEQIINQMLQERIRYHSKILNNYNK
ncbi:MAG: ATP-binding protein [Fibrobacter sp.]|jgi:SpoVK/Ycf46/Vps4 family AAA+-type ATPase|nr:ATP-binding protein [Fibrobacter sp.]NMB97007.1 ATP-binding protein [Clostridiaceae bacterium]